MLEDQRTEGTGTDCAAQIQQHLMDASTEELETELNKLILDESDSDEMIDLIQAYLKELDSRSPVQEDATSAEKAYQNFCEKHQDLLSETAPKKHRRVRPVRYIIFAAVIVVMVVLLIAPVSGTNLFSVLAEWTKDTFGFSYSGDTETAVVLSADPDAEYSDLWEALDAYGITEPVAPKHIPDGYEQIKLVVKEDGSLFHAVYKNCNKNIITINITKLSESNSEALQKGFENPEIYIVNNTKYYIMTNSNYYNAAWITSKYESVILNIESKKLLYEILNLIE